METTVAIPAEIVGDLEAIRERRDEAEQALAATARCLGRARANGRDLDWFLSTLADEVSTYDQLQAEFCRRRFVASDLAHAGERNPRFSFYVESAR